MALKSWLASLKADVSPVSAVQANNGAGFARYGTETADVSGVSATVELVPCDTADTAGKIQTYQRKPNIHAGCTPDTADTCEKINTEANPANDHLIGDDLTVANSAPAPEPDANPANWRGLALAYNAHHFNCPACIVAGRGSMYGQRCGVGAALWRAYQDA